MRYRELPGWDGAVEAATYVWRDVPAATWDAVGELEAPSWLTYLNGANELFIAAQDAGLVTVPLRRT